MNGDFYELLRSKGVNPFLSPSTVSTAPEVVHGTTVLAMRYDKGVLNIGDRRATAANLVMYDRADKILPLDDYTLIAVAGAFGKAMEVVRYLQHSFKYFARTQLHDMSLEGKLQEVSRALAGNLPNALQGIGWFIPVISAWDKTTDTGRIFFYDGSGARFESSDFGAAGSGSERIRGAFHYIERVKAPFCEMPLDEVLVEGLRLLDIAAELDSATAGFQKILPSAKVVSEEGIREISEAELRSAIERMESTGKNGRRQ